MGRDRARPLSDQAATLSFRFVSNTLIHVVRIRNTQTWEFFSQLMFLCLLALIRFLIPTEELQRVTGEGPFHIMMPIGFLPTSSSTYRTSLPGPISLFTCRLASASGFLMTRSNGQMRREDIYE